jgi:uncharacterized sporulation protein YeaH/YhbH (DUF444 family)
MHIVDRRLNPGSKSLENRQRFLRRAKALVQGAVKKSSEKPRVGLTDVPVDWVKTLVVYPKVASPIPILRS